MSALSQSIRIPYRVGKSTLIQGIAGKRIHTSFHKSSFSGETSTKTVFDAQDALPNFEIGHAKVSKTRSLNAFLRKIGDNEVVYLDSPGLEDTRGTEMDIATSAMLSQVAKRCKCLRFVILIHCASLLEDRGNAFRSILQFAKKFVEDFSASKTSFMFLFTHSHEITSMSNSSDDAKKRLHDEVIQTAGATKDEDVLAVLDFVRKSLKKSYPFADILLPIGTDYHKLAADIEKLRPVSDLASASSCNLTLSSKMKLEGAVQNLLERLQAVIRSSSPNNAAQVKEILRSFDYLREYVDVESVRKAARQSEEIVDDHKTELKRTIEFEFSRWTSSTSGFDKANAQALQDALVLLQDLDGTFSAKSWIQSKTDDAVKLQDEILMKASSCKKFRREFKKMQTWAEMFGASYHQLYADTCKKVAALFNEAIDIVSKTDPSNLHECSDEEASLFVEKLLTLQVMSDFSQTDIPEVNLEHALLGKILEDIKSVFKSWTKKAAELADSKTMNFKDDLKDVASHARVLESMNAILRKNDIGINSLDKSIESALSSLESDVIGLFTSCCDDLKNSSFDPAWEPKLQLMHDVCRRFSKMSSDRWKEMWSSFSDVTNKIKSVLHSSSGELENMSQVTREHGMRSGKRLGEEFKQFWKCKWVDSHLPQGEVFVANSCIAIELVFQTRIDETSSELEQAVTSLRKDKHTSTESIKKIHRLLPELEEIDKFLAVIAELADDKPFSLTQDPQDLAASLLAPKCASHLEMHTNYLTSQAKKYTSKWIANITSRKFGSLHGLALSLELIFANAQALNSVQSLEVVVQKSGVILLDITDACQKLSCLVDTELKRFAGDFRLKANILRSIKACSGLLSKDLPEYNDVVACVRSLVACEAQKLEREIEESSNWDTIDEHIVLFQAAVALDEFVNGEVSARYSTIQRLREKKEGQVDVYLQELISANNFKGIAEFLTPLAKQKDQIQKAKYESYRVSLLASVDILCCVS